MGLGNGNPKYGNKGSNYAYELANLKLLKQIVTALGGGGSVTKNASLTREINPLAGLQTTPVAYSVSFFNASASTKANVTGQELLPGESISFSSDGEGTLAPINYDADPTGLGLPNLVITIVQ